MLESNRSENPLPDIYLVSSTLHFFWAYMLAKKNEGKVDSVLILIDQHTGKPLKMSEYLTGDLSPFSTQFTLEGREYKGTAKMNIRRGQFVWINAFVQQHDIGRIFIGNDRSVIGQFFIKTAKNKDPSVKACYLDDGIFSYLGRADSLKPSEKWVDAFFKKFSYGFWYDPPETVGASKWVDEAWVMFPEEVNPILKQKKCVEILSGETGFSSLVPFATAVLKDEEIELDKISDLDALITVPNQKVFSQIDGYEAMIQKLLSDLRASGQAVGVKYHPEAGDKDPLGLEELGAIKLPSHIGFEVFIPFLGNTLVIGDFSTTVLMTQYAKQSSLITLEFDEFEMNSQMKRLLNAIGVKTASPKTLSFENGLKELL